MRHRSLGQDHDVVAAAEIGGGIADQTIMLIAVAGRQGLKGAGDKMRLDRYLAHQPCSMIPHKIRAWPLRARRRAENTDTSAEGHCPLGHRIVDLEDRRR